MFTGYNKDFPYAYVTESLVRAFPSWSKIRKDRTSLGFQFLNVTGLTFEEIQGFLDEALNNQYIGKANIGEIDHIYKISLNNNLNGVQLNALQDLDRATVVAYYNNDEDGIELYHCDTLYQFYAAPSKISATPTDAELTEPYILDYQEKVLYLKNWYYRVDVSIPGLNEPIKYYKYDNAPTPNIKDILPHHVWNVFDEFAMLLGIKRRYLEGNESLKERTLDVFRFPGNATKFGLIRSIGRELGLVYKATWPEDQESLQINEATEKISIIPETLIVNGARVKPDQYEVTGSTAKQYTLYPKTKVFFDKEHDYRFDNVRLTYDKKAVLNSGIKEGFIITPTIEPSNFKRWKKLLINGTGDIKVDVVRYDFEEYANQSQAYLVRDLVNNDDILIPGATPLGIDIPVKLIINLTRNLRSDPSPELTEIVMTYVPSKGEVSCIYGVELQALHDDEFRSTFFDERGNPKPEPEGRLLRYVSELNEMVPIMWGNWKWDESYWDVVGKNLMGLQVLPNKWDPYLGLIANKFSQTGIGDGLDCKVAFDESWYPSIHNGHYYISSSETIVSDGSGRFETKYPNPQFVSVRALAATPYECKIAEAKKNKFKLKDVVAAGIPLEVSFITENYLYANRKDFTIAGPTNMIVDELVGEYPMQGSPIIIEATKDGKTVMLKQMAFLNSEMTDVDIYNHETIYGNGSNKIAITYDQAFDITVNGSVPYSVTAEENVLTLDSVAPNDEELAVSYKVKDSFCVKYTEAGTQIILSDTYTNIKVSIESQDETSYFVADNAKSANNPCFDPLKTHISNGFLYITNEVNTPADLWITSDPDSISSNGGDYCLIIIDVVDRFENPVLNQTIAGSVTLQTDEATPTEIVPAGTLIEKGTYYNRHIFHYTPPVDLEGAIYPQREDGTDRIVPCTATLSFSCGSIQENVYVKVR